MPLSPRMRIQRRSRGDGAHDSDSAWSEQVNLFQTFFPLKRPVPFSEHLYYVQKQSGARKKNKDWPDLGHVTGPGGWSPRPTQRA